MSRFEDFRSAYSAWFGDIPTDSTDERGMLAWTVLAGKIPDDSLEATFQTVAEVVGGRKWLPRLSDFWRVLDSLRDARTQYRGSQGPCCGLCGGSGWLSLPDHGAFPCRCSDGRTIQFAEPSKWPADRVRRDQDRYIASSQKEEEEITLRQYLTRHFLEDFPDPEEDGEVLGGLRTATNALAEGLDVSFGKRTPVRSASGFILVGDYYAVRTTIFPPASEEVGENEECPF